MGIFDGILLCTDLDGTLLGSDRRVSDENVRAIEYFKDEGGIFTFITGRMPYYSASIHDMVRANAPFGCVNGGGVYDNVRECYVWKQPMQDDPMEIVRLIDERIAGVGIQVNTFDRVYFCRENSVMESFRQVTGVDNLIRGYDEIDEPIAKVIFGCPDGVGISEIEEIFRSHPMSDRFDYIRSELTLCEILPKGVEKGVALTKLAEYLNVDIKRTVAIGDYNNDISMLKAAGVGIAVANACPEAKAAADIVTVSNDENAVARVIYDIAENKIKLVK